MLTSWHVFAICTLFFSGVFVALILYWTITPLNSEIVEFPNGLHVVNRTVKAGENITIEAGSCKNHSTQSTTLTRSFQDEITYYIPVQESNVPTGCHLNYKSTVEIPKNLPPDTYTYNLNFTYRVNPIKTKEYSFQSNEFKVIK